MAAINEERAGLLGAQSPARGDAGTCLSRQVTQHEGYGLGAGWLLSRLLAGGRNWRREEAAATKGVSVQHRVCVRNSEDSSEQAVVRLFYCLQ